jgi:hypothetical protein
MFVILAIVLTALRAFTSQHYFMGGGNGVLRIRARMVCGMDGQAKASECIACMNLRTMVCGLTPHF